MTSVKFIQNDMKTGLQYRAIFSVLFHQNYDNKLLVTKYKTK